MSKRSFMYLLGVVTCLWAAIAYAQGVPIKSGATSDLMTVNTAKSALITPGLSTRATYIASTGAATCNQANVLMIEAPASTGFKLTQWCVNMSQATAAAAVNIFVRRMTTAGSGGTTLTAEGTGTTAVSKMDPADGNFAGIARGGIATPGTAGATLDQVGLSVGEIGAGTADSGSPLNFCKTYGDRGEKPPTVSAGTANGVVISMSASGAGGLSSCAMSATFIVE